MNKSKMTCRWFLLLAIWSFSTVSASAQTDPDATIAAIKKVLPNINPVKGAERLVGELAKRYKDNPKVLTGIGEAYYEAGDSAEAKKFFNKAIEVNPKYSTAYIAAGDWARDRYHDNDEALAWYDKAISINPQDSTGYLRSAKILAKQGKLDEAAGKLKTITAHVPSFPVSLHIAQLYSDAGKYNEAVSHYEEDNLDNMSLAALNDYAYLLTYRNMPDKGFDVSKYGADKFPERLTFNRYVLYNSTQLNNYEDAIKYGERFIYCTDTTKIKLLVRDYLAMGTAYQATNKWQNAIEMYEKAVSIEDKASEETFGKSSVDHQRELSYDNMAKIYVNEGEWDKAYHVYQRHYEFNKEVGRNNASVLQSYAQAYLNQSKESNGEEKIACYKEANRLYEMIIEEAPEHTILLLYNIAINCARIDQVEQSNAYSGRPYAERAYALLLEKEQKEALSEYDKQYLEWVCQYLGSYYSYGQNNKKAGRPYWLKAYEITKKEDYRKAANMK